MPERVTVRYVGPNHKTDKRVMKVSEQEAADLEAGGLWAKATTAKATAAKPKPEAKKEVKSND